MDGLAHVVSSQSGILEHKTVPAACGGIGAKVGGESKLSKAETRQAVCLIFHPCFTPRFQHGKKMDLGARLCWAFDNRQIRSQDYPQRGFDFGRYSLKESDLQTCWENMRISILGTRKVPFSVDKSFIHRNVMSLHLNRLFNKYIY